MEHTELSAVPARPCLSVIVCDMRVAISAPAQTLEQRGQSVARPRLGGERGALARINVEIPLCGRINLTDDNLHSTSRVATSRR